MKAANRMTTDHNEIRKWAEDRGAHPARVKGTGSVTDAGIIRLDFPGWSGERSLEPIAWEEFFEKFDRQGLALVYEETSASGEQSNYNKLVKRETAARKSGRNGGGQDSQGGQRRRARKPVRRKAGRQRTRARGSRKSTRRAAR